jgi:hypothetical protein
MEKKNKWRDNRAIQGQKYSTVYRVIQIGIRAPIFFLF